MDFFIDLIPALPFPFVAFGWIDMFLATKLAMVLALAQLAASRLRYGKIKRMHALTFAAIVLFGALTLALNNALFIKLRPTVFNWCSALVFLGAPLLFKKNLLKMMLAEQIVMPDFAWPRLNLMWVAYFLFMGALNLYVALAMSQEAWSTFHFFGTFGALLLFVVAQGFYVYRHMAHDSPVVQASPVAEGEE
jgi:intracellular septation protein